tara:strand:- start:574 stop:963 length:390 start_codon:yes stop_codon:yes gene_type:complete
MTKVKTTKTTNTTKAGKVAKPIKKRVNIYETDYGKQVLSTNYNLKKASKNVGGARAILLTMHTEKMLTLQPYQLEILRQSKKNQSVYETLKGLTRHHIKTGNTSPFYLLQAMYKDENRTKLLNLINKVK